MFRANNGTVEIVKNTSWIVQVGWWKATKCLQTEDHMIGPQGSPRSQGALILFSLSCRYWNKGCQSKLECAKKFYPTYISLFPFSDRSLVLGLHIATGEVSTGRLLQAFNLSTPLHCTHHCAHHCKLHNIHWRVHILRINSTSPILKLLI